MELESQYIQHNKDKILLEFHVFLGPQYYKCHCLRKKDLFLCRANGINMGISFSFTDILIDYSRGIKGLLPTPPHISPYTSTTPLHVFKISKLSFIFTIILHPHFFFFNKF
ncbi:hypothetical protein V8G54_023875 [Vigna mungo]|uniref:Uncharacterized protein n=1 Tax=Vigna mungo TaxID=3915 RepID=A0AAQ3RPL7_VIGMU